MANQILIKRNTLANIGTLGVGELYLATDTLDLYIGSASGNKLVGGIAALLAKVTATLDTDGTLAANSDTKVASQKATKTYADTKAPALGADDNYVTDTQKTNLTAGATGTFTTVDLKTVTVTAGIITNIV